MTKTRLPLSAVGCYSWWHIIKQSTEPKTIKLKAQRPYRLFINKIRYSMVSYWLERAAYRADLYRLSTLQIAVVDGRTGEYAHQWRKVVIHPHPFNKLYMQTLISWNKRICEQFIRYYTGLPKNVSHKLLSILLPSIDRFSKFFYWRLLWKIL